MFLINFVKNSKSIDKDYFFKTATIFYSVSLKLVIIVIIKSN